jgi:RNA polymerase sigma-70 factor, ECF subfamily
LLIQSGLGRDAGAVSVHVESASTVSASRSSAAAAQPVIDLESRDWLRRLRAAGPERDQAISDLRDLLLGAAGFEVRRRGAAMPHLRGGDFDDLARQSADDSLLAILGKLDSFRGDSRFTTWAYKFALLEAAVKLRRRAWQEREIVLEADHWSLLADQRSTPDEEAETSELMRAIGEAIEQRLTSHQREILVAITLNDVPIDVLAERLNTNRGALYKTLHDARRKLRACLSEQGLNVDPFRESQSP